MEKVKITVEQAEAIERQKEVIKNEHEKLKSNHQCNLMKWQYTLLELSTKDYMEAFFGSYEVEPEYKIGDYLYNESSEIVFVLGEPEEKLANTSRNKKHLRHATPEEIATEKQRRWWKKYDREVWELCIGDVLDRNGNLFQVIEEFPSGDFLLCDDTQLNMRDLPNSDYTLVCFAQYRKDI